MECIPVPSCLCKHRDMYTHTYTPLPWRNLIWFSVRGTSAEEDDEDSPRSAVPALALLPLLSKLPQRLLRSRLGAAGGALALYESSSARVVPVKRRSLRVAPHREGRFLTLRRKTGGGVDRDGWEGVGDDDADVDGGGGGGREDITNFAHSSKFFPREIFLSLLSRPPSVLRK